MNPEKSALRFGFQNSVHSEVRILNTTIVLLNRLVLVSKGTLVFDELLIARRTGPGSDRFA